MAGKGIEWLIDLDAKTAGATSAVEALDAVAAAATRLDQKLDKTQRALGSDSGWSKGAMNLRVLTRGAQLTDREFHSVQRRTAAVSSEIEKMGATEKHVAPLWTSVFKGELAMRGLQTAAHLAWVGVQKLGHTIADVVLQAAGEQRTGLSFENMFGAAEGKGMLSYLEKFAEHSEFTADQLKEVSAELARAGLRGADFRNAIGLAVDVAAQAPDKLGGLREAMAALSRISVTGKLEGRALFGLRLNEHDVAEQLHEDLGLSVEVIKQRLKEGTLKGSEAMASIFTVMERKTGRQLGALGEKMAESVSAKLAKVKAIPDELFQSLKDSPGFAALSSSLDKILAQFGPDGPAGKAIRDGLGSVLDFVGKSIDDVDWKGVGESIRDILVLTREWVPVLTAAASAAMKLTKALLALPTFGADIGDWMARKLHPSLGQDSSFWGPDSKAGREVIDKLSAQNEDAFRDDGVGSGAAFGEGVETGAKDALKIHSPSQVFADLGKASSSGWAEGFIAGQPQVTAAVSGVAAAPRLGEMSAGGRVGSVEIGTLSVPVSVTVGGSTSSSAEDIAREVELRAPSAVLAALEQLLVQGGIA